MRVAIIFLVLFVAASFVWGQTSDTASLNDPVTRLAKKIDRGEAKLDFSGDRGYLPSLLKNLDLNIDSQILVFSKTSFQQAKISPSAPRAIFFNDEVSVGSVQGGNVFELIALDPVQGLVYYTMDIARTEKPRFERRHGECLNCHGPANGMIVSSVYPAADGTPFVTGTFFEGIDQRTPLENRWGGWYVTGTHGSIHHMGNAVAPDPDHPFDLQEEGTQNLTSLAGRFDTSKYLAPTSDIVALMTLEHQAHMTNLIIGVSQQFRRAMNTGALETSRRSLDRAVEELVDYMLFVDEAPLPDPIKGVSTFTATFPQRGPRDSQGRSLRDFDLQRRLFRYPLSYMIYSEIFDAMPAPARERVYRRLNDVLTGRVQDAKFEHLSAADRRAILEIVRETKPQIIPASSSQPLSDGN